MAVVDVSSDTDLFLELLARGIELARAGVPSPEFDAVVSELRELVAESDEVSALMEESGSEAFDYIVWSWKEARP